MSRFIRTLSLALIALVIASLQLLAQGLSQLNPPAPDLGSETVLFSEVDHGHRVVLFLPESSSAGDARTIITVSNLTDAAVDLDVKSYDGRGSKLSVSHEVIEPLGEVEFSETSLPAGSQLIALEASGKIKGLVRSTWPDGTKTQINSLTPVANNFRVGFSAVDAVENADKAKLIIINFDARKPATVAIQHHEEFILTDSSTLYIGPMQVHEMPSGSMLISQGLPSSIAILTERTISETRVAYLAVDQDHLTSRSPHPGSASTTPFLCGGADTQNTSFCNPQSFYVNGRIHPALDIDKGTDGSNRNNRVMATLPGTVTSVSSNVICEACSGWGNSVIMRHLLTDGRIVHSGYGHLLYTGGSQAAGLTSADHVIGDQFLGYKGNTGGSLGSHLHFEVMSSINTFEGRYAPCAPHWTPPCENGSVPKATGSTTTEDPAPYMNGQRRALLPYFSRTASLPSEANYEVYGVANQRLYGALPLTAERSEDWMIAGKSETGQSWDIALPSSSGFVKTGYRDDLASDGDGTDYRFYGYHNQMTFGGGYQVKFTVLPDSKSKIVDNDSISGFAMDDRGTDGAGISDKVAGYYYSSLVYEARVGQYAKWHPNLSSGTYKIAVHIPKMPYGIKASAVRYKIYQTSVSAPVLSDPIDHRANHNQWVQLTSNGGAVQSWTFDGTGYIGLSIDQSGGNDGVAFGALVGVDAVKFITTTLPVLASVSVSGPSSVNESGMGSYDATATFSDGSNSIVTTSAAWSENSSAATISAAGVLTAGPISGNQSVTVTATYTYSGVTKSGTKIVTIVDAPKTLSSVSVSGPSSVNENKTGAYAATAIFSDGSNSSVTTSAIWGENSSATTISAGGVLSAGSVTSNQSVTVTATYTYSGMTRSGTKAVTIVDVPKTLSSVNLSGPSAVNEKTTGFYTATATFSDGSSSTVTASSIWGENSSATTISSAGVLSAGSVSSNQSVTVAATYTYGGITKSGTKVVTVVNVLTYTSSPAPGTYTSSGNVLKIKATFVGSTVTFTVAKQDGSAFTTGGTMTIRAGASYGCVANNNTYYWNFSSGRTTTSASFNLSQYFTSGSKDLYAAIGRPGTYCDGTRPTYYSGRLTITAQ